MFEATQLRFAYNGGTPVFNDLNISLSPGQVTGLIAPSGSGKTTLAKVLCGHLPAQSGQIRVNRNPIAHKSFLPVQLINQHPEQSFNPRWILERSLAESSEPKKQLLAELGIKMPWLNRYPHELSGGELQRLAIARALSPQTAFLIADEITAMLDAISQAQVWQVLLETVKQEQLGMLVISHNRELLKRVCHTTVTMNELSC
ncbi:MAG: ATP-binding cassette domain-containing protein [Candidatus Electrothrix communis]|nr:MAG: ATP-binding cassette domain-containing protein [Candidatus Electrothrix communis]